MIYRKRLFFRCLFAFWKMLWKIFYGVWRDGCSVGLCCGFCATVASVRAERSVREKARWLGVGWERAGRERKRGGSGCWGWLSGSGQWREESTVRKRESRDWVETREGDARVFWKMVYKKNFRKPFSLFYAAIFRSIFVNFPLTSVLQRPKRPKMLKTLALIKFKLQDIPKTRPISLNLLM